MAYIVRMPKLGMEMQEGELLEWSVDVGDPVEEDQVIAQIESEKSVADVNAREDGVLRTTYLDPGEVVAVATPMGIVAGADEDISELEAAVADELGETASGDSDDESASEPAAAAASSAPSSGSSGSSGGATATTQVKATPRAKQTARELGVELAGIDGTGPQGAVTADDVEAAAADSAAVSADQGAADAADVKATPRAKKRAEELDVPLVGIDGTGPQGAVTADDVEAAADSAEDGGAAASAGTGPTVAEERPFGGMRSTIADRLGKSYREAVHVTVNREMEVDALLEATETLDGALETDVSVSDVLLVLLSETLADHPEFNATFEDDTHSLYDEQHVGIAVDIEEGLVAPVLRDVGSLSLASLAEERRALTQKTLDGAYTMDDLTGGTFTVSNLGVLGVDSFDPVINPPQVAILGIGRIRERPTAVDGDVALRSWMTFSLSFDHRVVDGADAARFLDTLAGYLARPWDLLVDRL